MQNNTDAIRQEREWEDLYGRVEGVLGRFGKEDWLGRADYWIVDDNWGSRQQKVLVNNLKMLAPPVIGALQAALAKFPDWEIIVAVAIDGPGRSWPEMGLAVRPHEIVDQLQRQYFPREFQHLQYEGARSK